MKLLGVDDSFITRSVNDGFSGGEKKRLEILQMHMFQPRFAILDETDSGLDIDALKVVAKGIEALRAPDVGILLITHYERILRYVHAGLRPRARRWPHRPHRRPRARGRARVEGLRLRTRRALRRAGAAGRGRTVADVRSADHLREEGRRMAVTVRSASTSLDVAADPRRLPDPVAEGARRQAGRVPRQRGDQPEAAAGHRRDVARLRGAQREHPPRRLRVQRADHRAVRGSAREDGALDQRRRARDHLRSQRDRGCEPRRLHLGPREHQGRRSDRQYGPRAPLELRALAAAREGGRRGDRGDRRRRRRPPAPRPVHRRAGEGAREARRDHAHLERPRHRDAGEGAHRGGEGRGCHGAHRRSAGRAAHQGGREGHRLRLPGVQRAQDARAARLRARSGRTPRSSSACGRSCSAAT